MLNKPDEEFVLPEINQHTMERWIVNEPLPEEVEEIIEVGQYIRPDAIETIDPHTWDLCEDIIKPVKNKTPWAWIFLWVYSMLVTGVLIYSWWLQGFWQFMRAG